MILIEVCRNNDICTSSPELEMLNNDTQAAIFVGRKLYLPVVTKAYSGTRSTEPEQARKEVRINHFNRVTYQMAKVYRL